MSATMLAVLGAVVIAIGVGMVFVPAGVIAAGIELVAAGYVRRYLAAREPVEAKRW